MRVCLYCVRVQYQVDGTWHDMELEEELIHVKGRSKPERWVARSTRFGPVMTDNPAVLCFARVFISLACQLDVCFIVFPQSGLSSDFVFV